LKNLFRKRAASVGILATLMSAPPASFSQSTPAPQTSWAAVQSLKPNASVVVMTKDGAQTKGKLQSVLEDSLVVGEGRKAKDFRREDVLFIYTSKKSITKSTLIGAAVGAGAGVIFGAATGGCNSNDLICFSRGETIAVAAPLFAIPGAITGLIVGEARKKEVLVYTAKP
jgi:hypothetical protein